MARPVGERVRLEVPDAGPGMTLEQRARAFDPFWRSPSARRDHRGFGLGLPIVRRLVLADGGAVTLTAAGGLAVIVSLPAAPRPAPVRVPV